MDSSIIVLIFFSKRFCRSIHINVLTDLMVVEASTIMIRCYELVKEGMEEMAEHRERERQSIGF